jgi:hypothetical protein
MLFLNGPKKVIKGPQVGGTYDPMSKLKNKPLTKLLGPFSGEIVQNNQKTGLYAVFFFFIFGPFGHLKWTQKGTPRSKSGQDIWPNVLA